MVSRKYTDGSGRWHDEIQVLQEGAGELLADGMNAEIIASEIESRLPQDESRLYTHEELMKAANWGARAAISWSRGKVMDWPLRLRSAGAVADGADTWLPREDYQPVPLFDEEGEQQ